MQRPSCGHLRADGARSRNTIPIHCVIERSSPSLLSPGSAAAAAAAGGSGSSQAASGGRSSSTSPPLGGGQAGSGGQSSTSTDRELAGTSASASTGGQSGGSGQAQSASVQGSSNSGTTIEQDTYAILQANIPFTDIVRHVLTKLSYTPQEMVGAKGCPLGDSASE
ncbi:hypothetical protein TYRP_001396 [Tyrophagus putrescentiae]|nr:hypothetical protein TYRP_001396 [Tyrophagus putrescentiae]